MRRYSPSEKLSDEYLATERKTLENFLRYTFPNPYKAQVDALEQIEDRYEQLKEIVRLQDAVRSWFSSESFAKEWALDYLGVLKLAIANEDVFHERYANTIILSYAEDFFNLFYHNPEAWKYRNSYKDGRNIWHYFAPEHFSEETRSEILEIGHQFFSELWKTDFVLIEASKLSLDDVIFQHIPQNEKERVLKKRLEAVIKKEIKDFWLAKRDPTDAGTEDDYGFYSAYPATGKTYNWWYKKSVEKKCRLGKLSEYVAFLGVLLKKLVENGWTVEKAWYAVCVDSTELGNYRIPGRLGVTRRSGSDKICGFYDLANTRKLLAEDKDRGACWHAGGHCGELGTESPLATLRYDDERNCNHPDSVGWIVRDVEE